MKRIFALTALLLAVCLLFTACSGTGGVKRPYFLIVVLFLLSGAGIYFSWLAKKREEARERRRRLRARQRANRSQQPPQE